MSKTAVYAGTFDPITLGHLDIIARALSVFDTVIVAVATSSSKEPMFELDKRVAMIEACVTHLSNVKVVSFNSLLVDCVKENNANVIIRGLRSVTDFEYEMQLDQVNHSLDDTIQTLYLMPTPEHGFISSSIARTLLKFNAKVDHILPKEILTMVKIS